MRLLKSVIDFVMDILETIVFVGSLFIVIYLFIMGPNQVRGVSMEKTFQTGDYILTSRIAYKFKPIERGDVIVFKSPQNPDIEYIKRVIGLPGDIVLIKNGQVYVNDKLLSENYANTETTPSEGGIVKENEPLTIPTDYIFVMGDNRRESSDSRVFGPIKINSIVGSVFFRYFPSQKIGCITNPYPTQLTLLSPLFAIICSLFGGGFRVLLLLILPLTVTGLLLFLGYYFYLKKKQILSSDPQK